MKVMTVVGTRPELIRLSRIIALLDATCEHVLIHTGQNYDDSLNDVFFRDLSLRRPDYHLEADTSSLASTMASILVGTERVLLAERPDAFLVLGDTNSSISAVMAKRHRVPVYHMEAGNRCYDENVPEETNRRLVDHIADFNLPYTEHARRNLLSEGIHPRRILLTGSPMREVLEHYEDQIEASDVLMRLGLEPERFFLVSAHREENVDDPDRLRNLMGCLKDIAAKWGLPVIVSTHPRTRARLEALGTAHSHVLGVQWMPPFGFHDYNKLQRTAKCVLSDSGTVSEESSILGFRALTIRDSMERPEALDAGGIMMAGVRTRDVMLALDVALQPADSSFRRPPDEYLVRDTSQRVVKFMISTAPRFHQWAGIRNRL